MESADEEAAQRLCGWPITVGKRTIVPTLDKQEKECSLWHLSRFSSGDPC